MEAILIFIKGRGACQVPWGQMQFIPIYSVLLISHNCLIEAIGCDFPIAAHPIRYARKRFTLLVNVCIVTGVFAAMTDGFSST